MNKLLAPHIIEKAVVESLIAPLHDRIFSKGRSFLETPFQNKQWETMTFPVGMALADRDYEAIAAAARKVGDDRVILFPSELNDPAECVLCIPWSRSLWEISRCETILGHVDSHAFSDSELWGAALYYDDYVCIGGSSSFMETLTDQLGGRESVLNRFLEYAREEWAATEDFKKSYIEKFVFGRSKN
jgi:hypothetical protein